MITGLRVTRTEISEKNKINSTKQKNTSKTNEQGERGGRERGVVQNVIQTLTAIMQ